MRNVRGQKKTSQECCSSVVQVMRQESNAFDTVHSFHESVSSVRCVAGLLACQMMVTSAMYRYSSTTVGTYILLLGYNTVPPTRHAYFEQALASLTSVLRHNH